MSDYENASYRKSRKEKRNKRRYNPYKHGGKFRTTNITNSATKKE
ncbi:MAG: hypothetical protein PHD81_00365 [Candidatus Nanoarchaeia archaeon]|nr:hypothetical protein [Candidatus Nanoarchaeia archaeon]MDD5587545.1 hypothetical protein [Candidatus Nanoarchaeia archaeon]